MTEASSMHDGRKDTGYGRGPMIEAQGHSAPYTRKSMGHREMLHDQDEWMAKMKAASSSSRTLQNPRF